MTSLDLLFNNLIESEIEMLMDDSTYQFLATSLRSAETIKQMHRQQLRNFLEMKSLHLQLENAQNLILNMSHNYISCKDFHKIKGEFDNSAAHFSSYVEMLTREPTDRLILFQEMFGFSDETLLHIYDIATHLFQKKRFEDANDLFIYLTMLAPYVGGYWIGQGVCLQALDRHEDALIIFSGAKVINPIDPYPVSYSIYSYIHLKNYVGLKSEIKLLEHIVNSNDIAGKEEWSKKISEYKLM